MSLQNGVLGAFGLDFGGLGPPFWRVRASFSKALDVIFGTTNAKNAQKPAKTKAPSQGGQTAKGWVGGGDPPGGFQSAGHRRCANSVPNSFPTGSVQSQLANLDILSSSSFAQFDLKCSFPYPFLSPGAWGSPEPSSKKSLSASCWLILVVFFAFPTAPVK